MTSSFKRTLLAHYMRMRWFGYPIRVGNVRACRDCYVAGYSWYAWSPSAIPASITEIKGRHYPACAFCYLATHYGPHDIWLNLERDYGL